MSSSKIIMGSVNSEHINIDDEVLNKPTIRLDDPIIKNVGTDSIKNDEILDNDNIQIEFNNQYKQNE